MKTTYARYVQFTVRAIVATALVAPFALLSGLSFDDTAPGARSEQWSPGVIIPADQAGR